MSWLTWTVVIFSLDPQTGGALALALFYISFWLALLGTVTIIGFFLRAWLEKEGIHFRQLATALRQGTLISSGATIALMLQGIRWLNGWSGISLVLLLIVVEGFFLAGQTARRPDSPRSYAR